MSLDLNVWFQKTTRTRPRERLRKKSEQPQGMPNAAICSHRARFKFTPWLSPASHPTGTITGTNHDNLMRPCENTNVYTASVARASSPVRVSSLFPVPIRLLFPFAWAFAAFLTTSAMVESEKPFGSLGNVRDVVLIQEWFMVGDGAGCPRDLGLSRAKAGNLFS